MTVHRCKWVRGKPVYKCTDCKYESGCEDKAKVKERLKKRVPLRNSCRRKAKAAPDSPGYDFTGFYDEFTKWSSYTLQINQAGNHVEGWAQEIIWGGRGSRNEMTFRGSLEGKVLKVTFFDADEKSKGTGEIKRISGGTGHNLHITMNVQGSTKYKSADLRWRSAKPRLSEFGLLYLKDDFENKIIRSLETAPIPWGSFLWLQNHMLNFTGCSVFGTSMPMADFLKKALQTSREYRASKWLYRLNKYLEEKVFVDKKPTGWHEAMMPGVHLTAQLILQGLTYTHDSVTRTFFEWFQLMAYTGDVSGYSALLEDGLWLVDKKHAKMTSDPAQKHYYRFEFDVSGLSADVFIGIGAFTGLVDIFKLQSDKKTTIWKVTHKMTVACFGAGAGVAYTSRVKARSAVKEVGFEWQKNDFLGTCTILEAGAAISTPTSSPSISDPWMTVKGSENMPPITVKLDQCDSFGVGAQAGLTFYIGKIMELSRTTTDRTHEGSPWSKQLKMRTGRECEFNTGCAILKEEARESLRVLCAKELLFVKDLTRGGGRYSSKLSIKAHTDRVDCEQRNDELSKFRAENVVQAIEDIIGKKLNKKAVEVSALGEKEAKNKGDANNSDKAERRRVDVLLNGVKVVTIKAR